MPAWILIVIVFLLVMDTVISFVALYRTFKNKISIEKNKNFIKILNNIVRNRE